MNSIEYFKEHKYVVVENYLDNKLSTLFYNYVKNKVKAIDYKSTEFKEFYHPIMDGNFIDKQIGNGDYSSYGDVLMDTLLDMTSPTIKEFTGIDVFPTYSYFRLYTTNAELVKHTDRPSCEISTTLCLGMDTSNINVKEYPNYLWPIYIDGKPISLKPGDMVIYRGCEIEHWREPYKGLNHAQVFLHYNDKNGNNDNLYDGRPMLGVNKYRPKI